MVSSLVLHNLCSISPASSRCYKTQTLTPAHSNSYLKLKKKPSLLSNVQTQKLRAQKPRSSPLVFAAQSNLIKVLQTVWNVGKDGIEAGTNLVPASIPRPVARISITVVALAISLFVLKSFVSTAFFALATMGFAYFTFIALNKDNGPKGGGGSSSTPTSTEDSLEEARRIMEKYK
ncbi:uncharacterized protein LOC123216153 [Mangifera indica]|uniref:uncharacterized protein LOC123216153 n=1 Tax=Mangifera indica TaxID=29780 RepID=UPI001CFA705B|nr:uncharacterized protein LOC123216153 [Mangifera indica]